ncbi:hypothetical protein FZC33_07090 [Labrys sp. KNU-23]|uniref:hypothetical protein n=1 Tax=Labrys sp. KNU-23 TaxID=2789216 RepID=UPI0011ED4994|nr:hypothetical protein [Labrys sp. KNU-23]QEN85975.1 hypothetical protein FZC33_07090 [Labrys sp. KNU-23]
MKIDDNARLHTDGSIVCSHCDHPLGTSAGDPFANAIRRERPSQAAGPGVRAEPSHFTDRPIGLRQVFCPGCYVLLATEIAPTDEPSYRRWELGTHPPGRLA